MSQDRCALDVQFDKCPRDRWDIGAIICSVVENHLSAWDIWDIWDVWTTETGDIRPLVTDIQAIIASPRDQ